MKKLLCVLLAVTVLLALAACGEDPATNPATGENPTKPAEKVTIYINDTMTILSPDGTQQVTARYIYEEGWQEKESFSVMFEFDDPEGLLGGQVNMADLLKITYSEKFMVQETAGTSRLETVYDENGRAILTTTTYLMESAAFEKVEVATTYDEFGRITAQESKMYSRTDTEPESTTETITFVYTETDTGSECRNTEHSITTVQVYDKSYRLVCKSTIINGEEISRTEQEFDDAGNLIKTVNYSQGKKVSETAYTYTAVEVSAEFVQRMPQFKKVK